MEKYGFYSFDELTQDNIGAAILNSNLKMANELAEANRLKQIELELKIAELQCGNPDLGVPLGREDAKMFLKRLKDGSES